MEIPGRGHLRCMRVISVEQEWLIGDKIVKILTGFGYDSYFVESHRK